LCDFDSPFVVAGTTGCEASSDSANSTLSLQ